MRTLSVSLTCQCTTALPSVSVVEIAASLTNARVDMANVVDRQVTIYEVRFPQKPVKPPVNDLLLYYVQLPNYSYAFVFLSARLSH